MGKLILSEALVNLHVRDSIENEGSESGIRDQSVLDRILREISTLNESGLFDVESLATQYAVKIARERPFWSGNTRLSLVSCVLFLRLNGHDLLETSPDLVRTWRDLASFALAVTDFEAWLRANVYKLPDLASIRYRAWDED